MLTSYWGLYWCRWSWTSPHLSPVPMTHSPYVRYVLYVVEYTILSEEDEQNEAWMSWRRFDCLILKPLQCLSLVVLLCKLRLQRAGNKAKFTRYHSIAVEHTDCESPCLKSRCSPKKGREASFLSLNCGCEHCINFDNPCMICVQQACYQPLPHKETALCVSQYQLNQLNVLNRSWCCDVRWLGLRNNLHSL